ncbi:hypothetical protein GB937_010376 [Aspergillus fischeri]|nr:hypothetical protein GB937_010376 [Aspergillus fischeri]
MSILCETDIDCDNYKRQPGQIAESGIGVKSPRSADQQTPQPGYRISSKAIGFVLSVEAQHDHIAI